MKDFPRLQLSDLRNRYPGVFDEAEFVGVGAGWSHVLHQFIYGTQGTWPQLWIYELKQKNGRLKIGLMDIPEDVKFVVQLARGLAEMRSMYVCEICGEEGRIRQTGWLQCRCYTHSSLDEKEAPILEFYEPPRRPHFYIRGQKLEYDRALDKVFKVGDPIIDEPMTDLSFLEDWDD